MRNRLAAMFFTATLAGTMYFATTCLGETLTNESNVEFLNGCGFELGINCFDIIRYPKYPQAGDDPPTPPTRVSTKPLQGAYSLRLPELAHGMYILQTRAYPLAANGRYQFTFLARSDSSRTTVTVEVFSAGWKRVSHNLIVVNSSPHRERIDFVASATPREKGNVVAHFIRVWVSSGSAITIDGLSLRGPRATRPPRAAAVGWLEPDRPTSVYHRGASATMTFNGQATIGENLEYRIRDPIEGQTIASSHLVVNRAASGAVTATIPLNTTHRGFYWIDVSRTFTPATKHIIARRGYAVIVPLRGSTSDNSAYSPFGMCAAEFGRYAAADAQLSPGSEYVLMRDIGVGSVRVFSLLSPQMISRKGKKFDFSQADAALDAMAAQSIEPMVVLGSNRPEDIPTWMRTSRPSDHTVDLFGGFKANPHTTARIKRRLGAYRYLDLESYRRYLSAVFTHLHGHVHYYEIWNEPGFKFLPRDYLRIADLTRDVLNQASPKAQLLGFSSTKVGAQLGVGQNSSIPPRFLDEILHLGGRRDIDILSYHSGHAFLFFSTSPDYRNQETGYVRLLRKEMTDHDAAKVNIWDTERGVPWYSAHADQLDRTAGISQWRYREKSSGVYDIARNLPMIYAAELSAEIKRIFWFNWDSASQRPYNSDRRWGFFDTWREPMPQLPAYNAMAEYLSGTRFIKKLDRKDGTRAYLFVRGTECIVLGYNWEKRKTSMRIDGTDQKLKIRNIMGNPIPSALDGNQVNMTAWPVYVIIDGCISSKMSLQ